MGRSRFVGLKLKLGLPVVLSPPAYAEVNAEVEESHRDERREKLQHRSTQQEVPGVIELCKALIFWHTTFAHYQLPKNDRWAIQDKGKDPDGNHLDNSLMSHALPGTITHLEKKNSMNEKFTSRILPVIHLSAVTPGIHLHYLKLVNRKGI